MLQEIELKPGNGYISEITVLALVLRDIDELTATLSPADQTNFLNGFYPSRVAIIHKQDGEINYYIQNEGGLVAWFDSSQQPEPDHSLRALNAAREIIQLTRHPLAVSIGIDTGRVFVGNVGSKERIQYGPVGVPVNKALQIAQVARQRRIDILLSDEIVHRMKNSGTIELTDSIEVLLPEREQSTLMHVLSKTH
ncbi:MAG: adenylate cyclase [Microgenomates group bacterium Gr01-1014_7]|nr:MAG: adenylate cyclase [Microgenomates group bacterium Gr01-1014_7]